MLTDADIVARASNKAAVEMGDEIVVMDIETGVYFQLNKVGARIWSLLEAPMPVAALCARLEAAFEIDPATCRADVADFLETMRDKGLATIS